MADAIHGHDVEVGVVVAVSLDVGGVWRGVNATCGVSGPAGPGIPVGGCHGGKRWVSPGGFPAVGTVPTGGTLIVPAPIPFAAPCVIPPNGVTIYVQFVNILGSSGLELTDSLSFTIGSL